MNQIVFFSILYAVAVIAIYDVFIRPDNSGK